MIGIYKIENISNGKTYFGQTVDYEKRKDAHIRALNGGYHRNRYLQSAWMKYGAQSFRFSFVESCDEKDLDMLERAYILCHKTLAPTGYNLTAGGDGVRGLKWSEESRKSVSETRKGKPRPPRKEEKQSESSKAKISASMKAKWQDESYRERLRNSHLGKTFSQETKDKMSNSRKGRVQSNARKVLCVETGIIYPSVNQIDLGRKINTGHIYRSHYGGIKAYGYHWKLL